MEQSENLYTDVSPLQVLYGLCFVLEVFCVGFSLPRAFPDGGMLLFYLIASLYLFIHIIQALFRVILVDITERLGYRELFGVFLIHAGFVVFPMMFFETPNLVVGLAFLNIPLIVFLLRPHNFAILYLNNLLIFILGLFFVPNVSFFVFVPFCFLLLITFIVDYFGFRFEKYEKALDTFNFKVLVSPVLATFILVIFVGIILFLITPHFRAPVAMPDRGEPQTVTAPARTIQPVDTATILRLALEIVGLLIMIFVLLALLNWLHKKMRRRRGNSKILKPSGTITHIRKRLKESVSATFRINLDDPRTKVIYHYNLFCDHMKRAGMEREKHVTPKDYETKLSGVFSSEQERLQYVRKQFESAKYSLEPISRDTAKTYQTEIDAFLTELKNEPDTSR